MKNGWKKVQKSFFCFVFLIQFKTSSIQNVFLRKIICVFFVLFMFSQCSFVLIWETFLFFFLRIPEDLLPRTEKFILSFMHTLLFIFFAFYHYRFFSQNFFSLSLPFLFISRFSFFSISFSITSLTLSLSHSLFLSLSLFLSHE